MIYDEDLPDFRQFNSDELKYYFKLLELLKFVKENPLYAVETETAESGIEQEKYLPNAQNLIDSSLLSSRRGLGIEERDLLFSEKEVVNDFFRYVIDQHTFRTPDHNRIRTYLKDWYTAHRTLVTKSRNAINPYNLTAPELDELILSFGFPYPYELDRDEKAELLHHLIEYYKHKGSPDVLGDVLGFFGRVGVVLSEWWLEHVPSEAGPGIFVMNSKPVWPADQKNNEDHMITLPYEQFVASDPLWHYDKPGVSQKVSDLFWEIDPKTGERVNKITLPSITPYLSLNNVISHQRFTSELSILNRKIQEAYEYWVEYELNYKGTVSGTNPDVWNGEANDIVLNTTTDTHWVYNGIKWVNLRRKLPQDLVESAPDCPLKPSQYAPREVLLNIAREVNVSNLPEEMSEIPFDQSFTFFEAILGMFYLLGTEYLVGLRRLPHLVNGSPVTVNMLETDPEWLSKTYDNYIVYIQETNTDWVTYQYENKEGDMIGTWLDLNYVADYQSTTGEVSALLFRPKGRKGYLTNRFLQYGGDWEDSTAFMGYPGEYAPLDYKYLNEIGEYDYSCRDAIDDSDYDLIVDEFNNIMARPEDTIDNELNSWSQGTDIFRHSYYSLRDQRIDKLKDFSWKFFRYRYVEEAEQDSSFLEIPNVFLEAANATLYHAICNRLFVVGVTFPLDFLRLNRIKERYLNDLALYLMDIGLPNLGSITSVLVGHALHENLLNIINFFKPFRARFRSFLTEYQIDDPVGDGAYVGDEFYLSGITQFVHEHPDIHEFLGTTIHMLFEEGDTDIFDGWSRNLFDEFFVSPHLIFEDQVIIDDGDTISVDESIVPQDHVIIDDQVELLIDNSEHEPKSPVFDAFDPLDSGGIKVIDADSGLCVAEPEFETITTEGCNILNDYHNLEYHEIYNPVLLNGWVELDGTAYTPISDESGSFGSNLITSGWEVHYDTVDSTNYYYLKTPEFVLEDEKDYRLIFDYKNIQQDVFFYPEIVSVANPEITQVLDSIDFPENWDDGSWHRFTVDFVSQLDGDVYIKIPLDEGHLTSVDIVSIREVLDFGTGDHVERYWKYNLFNKILSCKDVIEPFEAEIDHYFTFLISDYETSFEYPLTSGTWKLFGNIEELNGQIEVIISSTFDTSGEITSDIFDGDELEITATATDSDPINAIIIRLIGGNYCRVTNFSLKKQFVSVI